MRRLNALIILIIIQICSAFMLSSAMAVETQSKSGKIVIPLDNLTKEYKTHYGHNKRVFTVVFSPDGKKMASGDEAGLMFIWELTTGKKVTLPYQKNCGSMSMSFSPDGKLLASGCSPSRDIIIWDAASGKKLKGFTPIISRNNDYLLGIHFSSDGMSIIAALASLAYTTPEHITYTSWAVKTGEKRINQHNAKKQYKDMARKEFVSNDGKFSAGGRGMDLESAIRVSDQALGKYIWMQNLPAKKVAAKSFDFYDIDVKWSPIVKVLASARKYEEDILIDFWEAATGIHISALKTHSVDSEFNCGIAFSPDGKTLALWDGNRIILWDITGVNLSSIFLKDEFETNKEYEKRLEQAEIPYKSSIALRNYNADEETYSAELAGVALTARIPKNKAILVDKRKEKVSVIGKLRYFDAENVELVNPGKSVV